MLKTRCAALVSAFVFFLFPAPVSTQTKPRARDLGAPFDGTPGKFNAITDVKTVEVGHTTLISGEDR
jgi:D-aminopeptidase